MAVLVFPVTRVFKYVNLTSSVKDCESMALLYCPKTLTTSGHRCTLTTFTRAMDRSPYR